MDLTTIGGIIFAFTLILWAQALEGGNAGQLMQITAFLIVFGGTVGATVVSFPAEDLMGALQKLTIVFGNNKVDFHALIQQLLSFATKARKEGVIALEKEAQHVTDPILKVGLEAVSDGADPTLVRDLMEIRIGELEEQLKRHAKVWESAGAYAPTIGIIGAVLGLIQVMQNLSDPSKLGAGIAVAFVATIYGLVTANIFCIPFSSKIKLKGHEEFLAKQMIVEGILSIQAGESPALIERKLQAFLAAHDNGKHETKA